MLKILLVLSLIPLSSLACTEPGTGFLPPHSLRLPPDPKAQGISREEYDAIIDKVLRIYAPVARRHGAKLQIERKWESDTVNAGTFRASNGKKWVVNLYGGFARHPYVTVDGYALVICHEIGHHIGGAPKKSYPESGPIWASTEGQSDYFATLKCLRKVFRRDDNRQIVSTMEVPESVRTECQDSFRREWEVSLCIRTSMAGLSVARVNADIRRVPLPELEAVDPNVVEVTSNNHPEPQCRLNTYYQGSICPVPSTRSVSQSGEVRGTCHEALHFSKGLRPACWYKPK